MKLIDLTGKRFGRLVVESYERLPGKNASRWICTCDCGNIKKVHQHSLARGNTKSCGCLAREETSKRSRRTGTYLRMVYYRYKANAKLRNIEFLISIEQMEKIIKQDCIFCGSSPIEPTNFCKAYSDTFNTNGMDRFDNNKPYNIDNLVPCCKHCNRMKRDHSVIDFKQRIKNIYDFWVNK